MKKVLLIACGLLIAGVATAQENVLKEAKRGLQVEVPNHSAIADMLANALKDPATAENVEAWFLAGKNAFQTWQTGKQLSAIGETPDEVNMSKALINGFEYFDKAFTMDTIITVDKKGKEKIKTKYSKEMANTLIANYKNYEQAFGVLYNANDIENAFRALKVYTTLPSYAPLGAKAPQAPVDSLNAQDFYNLGMLALMLDKPQDAIPAFESAMKHNFGVSAYYQIIRAANDLKDEQLVEKYGMEGFQKYNDPYFLSQLVALYAQQKNYKKGHDIIAAALESDPNNATLLRFKGITAELISEEEGVSPEDAKKYKDEAYKSYEEAYKVAPEDPEVLYNYGRMLTAIAYKTNDDAVDLTNAEFAKLKADVIDPQLRQAAEAFEKALAKDKETHRDIFSMLKGIYYNLNDEENMKRIEELQLQ
ncbi:MAG: hypothetical protein NC301_04230 [Bacteroides sp.]|nr:hypothetical protein [Bacteroides sp.]MCM1379468.1 hypothetical protein [Bacteroides sp.]MCM1445929.1 hypothetical protein [Prevotella sp.]